MSSLPRSLRLPKKEIKKLFLKGKKISLEYIFLIFLKNQKKQSYFAVIVSSKGIKKSVKRNKIKRQVKSIIIKYIIPLMSVKEKNYDIIFVIKKIPPAIKDLKNNIQDVCEKANII